MAENDNQSKPHERTVFLKALHNSQLVSEEQYAALLQFLKSRTGKNLDSQLVINHCVESKLLTRWQCRQLADGKHKGFFLGRFKLLDVLGSGGMSTVFLAEHVLSGQRRALKILPPKKLNQRSYLKRFYREGRAVASLNHPNIIRIYDITRHEKTHFMVMEFIDGVDLNAKVEKEGVLGFDICRICIQQAATGLAHAHENAMVHRDIKPANLYLTDDSTIKVLDLGLNLLKSDPNQFGLSVQHDEMMIGTADYLAPEQAVNSHDVDHRADVYSLGCTLYFLLAGQPPFAKGTMAQRIAAHQFSLPRPITDLRVDCPPDLDRMCQKMMAKDPRNRFQNCSEIVEAISNAKQSPIHLANSAVNLMAKPNVESASTPKQAVLKRHQKQNRILPVILLMVALFFLVVILSIVVLNGKPPFDAIPR